MIPLEKVKDIIEKQNVWPFLKLGHFVVAINDIIDDIVNKILSIKEESFLSKEIITQYANQLIKKGVFNDQVLH